jgi:glutaredoxin
VTITSPSVTTSPPDRALITVVVSPGCHFCADAEDALADIGREFPLQVTRVDLRSPEGLDLAQRHGAAMSPLVLLDGTFVSAGRLPRGRLRSLLSKRQQRTQAVVS